MTAFYELPELFRTLFSLWTLLICCAGIICIVLAFAARRIRYAAFSLLTFLPAYLLWQLAEPGKDSAVYPQTGGVPWLVWLLILIPVTFFAVLLFYRSVRYAGTRVTPLAINRCADRMSCGICYWRDNGHVIFFNDCMNGLSIALTGRTLTNGNHFRAAVPDGILPVGNKVWSFACRDVILNGETLHELIASDVSEIHAKTDALRKDNEQLARLNEELRAYSRRIDETVRRQEILQARVNIHDEMNRLMLSTTAADIRNEQELNRIFSMWERNAVLLCLEADGKKDESAAGMLEGLARTLGIHLEWNGEIPGALASGRRELFLTAAREAIANAVKHAAAKNIRITFTETDREICCRFENDGAVPKGAIRFTGGLANLAALADGENACLSAASGETFLLMLRFPKPGAECAERQMREP